ncbi:hypothetical protein D3C77_240730 [compost metagenome]
MGDKAIAGGTHYGVIQLELGVVDLRLQVVDAGNRRFLLAACTEIAFDQFIDPEQVTFCRQMLGLE